VNLISTLVTIVVLGSGGPPSTRQHNQALAAGISNSTISVFRYDGSERRPYATLYEGGELTIRLRPGIYSVEAHLTGSPTTLCKSVRLSIGHRKTERVQLWCNTK
jgi:hypothetical protein